MPNILIDKKLTEEVEKYLKKIDPDLIKHLNEFFLGSAIKESAERLGLEIKRMTTYENGEYVGAYVDYSVK
ncbi:hypothetical protein KAJ61_05760 [Candidatus Parcubacteria bacterium]|nr:hypothetical protein [Candidatus Parcubacteria bacterium]